MIDVDDGGYLYSVAYILSRQEKADDGEEAET